MDPLGIRNCNPGNIEKGDKWQGMDPVKTEKSPRFIVFTEMKYGCRALLYLLHTYYTRRDCTTIRSIIKRYAPEMENPTKNYMRMLEQHTGYDVDETLPMNKFTFTQVAKAIVHFECGSPADTWITKKDWEDAYALLPESVAIPD